MLLFYGFRNIMRPVLQLLQLQPVSKVDFMLLLPGMRLLSTV